MDSNTNFISTLAEPKSIIVHSICYRVNQLNQQLSELQQIAMIWKKILQHHLSNDNCLFYFDVMIKKGYNCIGSFEKSTFLQIKSDYQIARVVCHSNMRSLSRLYGQGVVSQMLEMFQKQDQRARQDTRMFVHQVLGDRCTVLKQNIEHLEQVIARWSHESYNTTDRVRVLVSVFCHPEKYVELYENRARFDINFAELRALLNINTSPILHPCEFVGVNPANIFIPSDGFAQAAGILRKVQSGNVAHMPFNQLPQGVPAPPGVMPSTFTISATPNRLGVPSLCIAPVMLFVRLPTLFAPPGIPPRPLMQHLLADPRSGVPNGVQMSSAYMNSAYIPRVQMPNVFPMAALFDSPKFPQAFGTLDNKEMASRVAYVDSSSSMSSSPEVERMQSNSTVGGATPQREFVQWPLNIPENREPSETVYRQPIRKLSDAFRNVRAHTFQSWMEESQKASAAVNHQNEPLQNYYFPYL